MPDYMCQDSDGVEVEISAHDAEEAAQIYVDLGCYDPTESTYWVDIKISEDDGDNEEIIKISIHPTEPDCESATGHHWLSPHIVVGGLAENPGMMGHRGGIVRTEWCPYCGAKRLSDSWAQDPVTGEQGLDSLQYQEGEISILDVAMYRADVIDAEIHPDGKGIVIDLNGPASDLDDALEPYGLMRNLDNQENTDDGGQRLTYRPA